VLHNDGNVYAITHDRQIWKHDRANKTWTSIGPQDGYIPVGLAPLKGHYRRKRDLTWKPAVLPQLVSFNGSLYMVVRYLVRYSGTAGSCNYYAWAEIAIIKIDPAAGTGVTVFQMRGDKTGDWLCIGSDESRWVQPATFASTLVDGYLWTDGTNLYYGGGGAKRINPAETGGDLDATYFVAPYDNHGPPKNYGNPNPAVGGKDAKYVFYTADGTTWNTVNRLKKDQYDRDVPMAMPNGYRLSHLISFDSMFWDYYGYYDPADKSGDGAFAFTAKIDGVHTEPWGRFQMGAGSVNGTDRLFRVGFNKKGTQNFIYSITGTGGTWAKYGAGAPNDGTYYWRGFAVLKNTDDTNDDSAGLAYNEELHNGLYATYSKGPAGGYESGVWRYANIDTDSPGDGTGNGWAWSKVRSTGDARVYTGAILAVPNDDGDPTKGSIFVGTSAGVYRRGTGRFDFGLDNVAGGGDDINVMPQ